MKKQYILKTSTLAALALACSTVFGNAWAGKLPYVTDSYGRDIVMRGYSASNSAKYSSDAMPWETQSDIIDQASATGASVVRLIIFWNILEPVQGQYNAIYMANIVKRVQMYENAGINVILDMHQDLYGPWFSVWGGSGGNSGAPKWATFDDGLPTKMVKPWGLMYFQPGMERAFDHLWGTVPTPIDLRLAYAQAWQHVAQTFASTPNVLGYDLFNEPFGGGAVRRWTFEETWLPRFYEASIAAIRQVDNNKWIFVEPDAFLTNQGDQSYLRIPSDVRVGPPHIAYAPHVYPLTMEAKAGFTGLNKLATEAEVSLSFTHAYAKAKQYNVPLWIGEVGAGDFTQASFRNYMKYVIGKADAINAGWSYWATDSMQGTNLPLAASTMSSPYAKAVPGAILSDDFNASTQKLVITWQPKAAKDNAPLEVYLPSSSYPKGYTYDTNLPHYTTTWDSATQVLSVTYDESTAALPGTLSFAVTAKK